MSNTMINEQTPDELSMFMPEPRMIALGNQSLAIHPLKVGQLPSVLRLIYPLIPSLTGTTVDWLGILAEHGDALLQLIAIGVNQPRTWVDALDVDELIVLATALIEVNADFLIQRVMPKLAPNVAEFMPTRSDPATQTPPTNDRSPEIGSTSANI